MFINIYLSADAVDKAVARTVPGLRDTRSTWGRAPGPGSGDGPGGSGVLVSTCRAGTCPFLHVHSTSSRNNLVAGEGHRSHHISSLHVEANDNVQP